jgi:cytochrome P450
MGPLLGRGIFVTDGAEWAHSRAVLRPNFVKDQVADLGMVNRHIEHLLALVRPHAQAGTKVDLQPLFLRFTLDSATEFLFNESTETLSRPGKKERDFSDAFQLALDDIATTFRMGPLWKLRRTDAKVLKAYKVCRAYVDQFVDSAVVLKAQDGAVASREDDTDVKQSTYFLKELAKSTSDKDKIRDELLNILIAGRDTATSLLSSLFHALSRHPEMWAKVREEVRQFDGKLPEYEQLRHLKYAKYCINESKLAAIVDIGKLTRSLQHSGFGPQCHQMYVLQLRIPFSHMVAAKTATNPSTSRREVLLITRYTQCTGAPIFSVQTPRSSGPSDGLAKLTAG